MADARGGGGGGGGSKGGITSLSQLQSMVSVRKSAVKLAARASSAAHKATVKCTRCGTKKRVAKDKLNKRTKCVCGETFVAQASKSKKRGAVSYTHLTLPTIYSV